MLLIVLVACQAIPLFDTDDDNDYLEKNDVKRSFNSEQLAELGRYLSRRFDEEPESEAFNFMTDYSNGHRLSKRDALWTTTEVLECVRRLKYSKNISKLDLVTEMLNCYRRLKHSG